MTREDELYADELRDRAYSDYERLDLAIQALEAQPTDEIREAYIKGYDYGVKDWFKSKTQPCEDYNWKALWHQVKKERDIAISQLHELGYEFGEKIEPCEDFVSRSELLRHQHIIYDDDEEGYNVVYVKDIKAMPPVTPSYNSIKTELKPCEDCISRAEVLRHQHIIYDDDEEGYNVVYVKDIKAMPPVTPSYNSIKTELKPCEDCISRAEVLRHQHIIYDDDEEGYNVVYVKDIKAMPPVTPSYNSIETELKPCEDCISRAEVLRHSHTEYDDDGEGHKVIYTEDIEELPSVTPRTNLAGLHKQTGSA